jgi:hypothetical protein
MFNWNHAGQILCVSNIKTCLLKETESLETQLAKLHALGRELDNSNVCTSFCKRRCRRANSTAYLQDSLSPPFGEFSKFGDVIFDKIFPPLNLKSTSNSDPLISYRNHLQQCCSRKSDRQIAVRLTASQCSLLPYSMPSNFHPELQGLVSQYFWTVSA